MKRMRIFLGGTVGNNTWRPGFMQALCEGGIPKDFMFDPVLPPDAWNDAAADREAEEKRKATHFLYYLANPLQDGNPVSAYSMHEAATALAEDPKRTVVVFDFNDFHGHSRRQMLATKEEFQQTYPGSNIFEDPESAIAWLLDEYRRPAVIQEEIILDGTVGNNGWREDFTTELLRAGVPETMIINPVVANYTMTVNKVEAKQREKASLRIFYLASPLQNDNPMSALAIVRAQIWLRRRPYDTVVVFNPDKIAGHHLKTFNRIAKEFKQLFPRAAILNSLEEARDWVITRMSLE